MQEKNLPVPNFALVEDIAQNGNIISNRFPLILKACEDSYHGRGNRLIYAEKDIINAANRNSPGKWMVEEVIPFKKELSSWLPEMNPARSPPFLWQKINILTAFWILLWFLRISKSKEKKAREIAERTVNVLKGSGIFCVEMFLNTNGDILINEIAPRPHNSGHYSIEGCSISQFEQHIRAILNLPLPKPRLSSPDGDGQYIGTYRI